MSTERVHEFCVLLNKEIKEKRTRNPSFEIWFSTCARSVIKLLLRKVVR